MSSCIKALSILVFLLLQRCRGENKYCAQAVESIVRVQVCPTTKEELDKASDAKNCKGHAERQNCSASEKFKYHCVINSYRNETLEVCAPERRIVGGDCTEFNVLGGVIQSHATEKCDNPGFPQCNYYYLSSLAYEYQGCYRLVNRTKSIPPLSETSENRVMIITLPVIFVTAAIVVGIAIAIYLIRFRRIRLCQKKNTERKNNQRHKEREELLSKDVTSCIETIQISLRIPTEIDTEHEIGPADIFGFARIKTIEDYREENIERSRRYLKYHQKINKYFVNTNTYKNGENIFYKYGIVVWTGRPGCGKTAAAIHLILKHMYLNENWNFRKLSSWNELSYIDTEEKTLVFIDNIFYQKSQISDSDLENWWTELRKIHSTFFQSKENELSHIRIIFTARETDIKRVCSYMDNLTPILNRSHWVNLDTLTEYEREEILKNQIEFATIEKNIPFPSMEKDFLQGVRKSDGPIGFPFCAHLFACIVDYRKSGAHFFSRPIQYLKKQIKDEVWNDKSNRTKTVLFVLFFHEWHTKTQNVEPLEVDKESKCRDFLDGISPDLCRNFEPFDFKNLTIEANRLCGVFLQKERDNVYKFVHDSVYEAVGTFLCEEFVAESAKYFPLDVMCNQEYDNITEDQAATLVTRLLYETLHQRHSQVFACKVFQRDSFVELFYSELMKKDDKTVKLFFTVTNETSPVKLPCMFWTSYNKLTHLREKLNDIVIKQKINPDYQFYVSLYGECCASNERVLKTLNGMLQNDLEELKKRVFNFKDDEGNSILHLLIESKGSDEFLSVVVQKLLHDGINVDSRNTIKMTPLMFAVEQPFPRKKVVEKLKSSKLHYMDAQNRTVIHHCLISRNDDETCAENLKIVLRFKNAQNFLARNDDNGNTALCFAAMESEYSRIISISILLTSCSKEIIKAMNAEGYSPLNLSVRSLKGKSAYVELECCVRVILLLSYGGRAENKSDADNDAIGECEFGLITNILNNPKDTKEMANALRTLLERCTDTGCKTPGRSTSLPDISEHTSSEIQSLIEQASEILKNFRFQ